jgi:hypothetical protein
MNRGTLLKRRSTRHVSEITPFLYHSDRVKVINQVKNRIQSIKSEIRRVIVLIAFVSYFSENELLPLLQKELDSIRNKNKTNFSLILATSQMFLPRAVRYAYWIHNLRDLALQTSYGFICSSKGVV